MSAKVQKITLPSSRDIPFEKLVLSQSNVRRIKAGLSIEDLAESIARRGLIQSLHVRPILDEAGAETGLFEVPAGGRRYRALALLVAQKRLSKTAPVPCIVSSAGSDILIDEVSLAENIERAPLHPLDQFRAFEALRQKGLGEEEIAAAFFVGVNVVKQRLRLASASPALLEVYAEDGMTLEQLMAFTVTEDHRRQEEVWAGLKDGWQKEPWQIRRLLTETSVRASDRRAQFVGVDAYQAAGGVVLRDLFQSDEGGYLQDVPLLDRLVAEKLNAAAEEIRREGWKWVEAAVSFPYGHDRGLQRLTGLPQDLTPEDLAARQALTDEYDRLSETYDASEDLPEEIDQRLAEIETALKEFSSRPLLYDPAEVATAGVFISLGREGELVIERGLSRPEDLLAPGGAGHYRGGQDGSGDDLESEGGCGERGQEVSAGVDSSTFDEEEIEDGAKPLPERLLAELTAHRTLALRDAIAEHPRIAETLLLHRLVSDAFLHRSSASPLEASVRTVYFPIQHEDLKDCPSARSVAERHARFARDLPSDEERLFDWLEGKDNDYRASLLAHLVSFGVNALHERSAAHGGNASTEGIRARIGLAGHLATKSRLDMAKAGWRPTVSNYLGRVPKTRILEAVREGAGVEAGERLQPLKKPEMALAAEELLKDSGWLPEPLRTHGEAVETSEATETCEEESLGEEDHPEDDCALSVAAE